MMMTPMRRARIASRLAAKVQELVGIPTVGTQAIIARARASREVVALIAELRGERTAEKEAESPALKVLAAIADGGRDTDEIGLLYADVRDSVMVLAGADELNGWASDLAHQAITRWAQIEEKTYV